MARRASRRLNPAWISGAILLVAAAIGGSFFFFGQTSNLKNHGLEDLNPLDYMENANSLRGNVYKIEGTVLNAIAWSQSQGRLISVQIEFRGNVRHIPVLLPTELNSVNVRQGQKVSLKVKVEDKGILVAESFDKI